MANRPNTRASQKSLLGDHSVLSASAKKYLRNLEPFFKRYDVPKNGGVREHFAQLLDEGNLYAKIADRSAYLSHTANRRAHNDELARLRMVIERLSDPITEFAQASRQIQRPQLLSDLMRLEQQLNERTEQAYSIGPIFEIGQRGPAKDQALAHLIQALAIEWKDLKDEEPRAYWNDISGTRATPFTQFVREFCAATKQSQWLQGNAQGKRKTAPLGANSQGLEMKVERVLSSQRQLKNDRQIVRLFRLYGLEPTQKNTCVTASKVYTAFTGWCDVNDFSRLSQARMQRALGLPIAFGTDGINYLGVRIKPAHRLPDQVRPKSR